jgi:hypothetical protein
MPRSGGREGGKPAEGGDAVTRGQHGEQGSSEMRAVPSQEAEALDKLSAEPSPAAGKTGGRTEEERNGHHCNAQLQEEIMMTKWINDEVDQERHLHRRKRRRQNFRTKSFHLQPGSSRFEHAAKYMLTGPIM